MAWCGAHSPNSLSPPKKTSRLSHSQIQIAQIHAILQSREDIDRSRGVVPSPGTVVSAQGPTKLSGAVSRMITRNIRNDIFRIGPASKCIEGQNKKRKVQTWEPNSESSIDYLARIVPNFQSIMKENPTIEGGVRHQIHNRLSPTSKLAIFRVPSVEALGTDDFYNSKRTIDEFS